ncbi:nitroreductase [uncultured Acinetobacter sp.]|uniref:nitroreductase family protein n=1 Tax=uncultured Acinetobacter sp. TaxID=165433 RepID=UPI002583AAC5|nr:nitroreductase [uncultured Acinetobacter sp.]
MTELDASQIHHVIHQRQSIGQLTEPAPSAQQLNQAFQAALTAPDHHRLKPTRFFVIDTEQRAAFGEALVQALEDLGETDPNQLDRVKQHPFRAPLLVIAATHYQDHPKVPLFEQTLSTGAAIQNFLLSLQAQGFSTMWRTGAVIESTWLKQHLGLEARDLISGIIYVGTAAKSIAPRAEVKIEDYVTQWPTR